jgi:putative holliday junction resolvase
MEKQRILALDYGRARIGVAISDELGLLAHPRPFVPALPPNRALRLIKRLAEDEKVRLILLGLPTNMDGSEGRSAALVRKFAADLQKILPLPIEFSDERLSTVQAQGLLGQAGSSVRDSKGKIDSASAAVLLQAFLDVRGAPNADEGQ